MSTVQSFAAGFPYTPAFPAFERTDARFASCRSTGLADEQPVEDVDTDGGRCRTCHSLTEGVTLAGQHVQMCPHCVVGEMVAVLGHGGVRDAVAAIAPTIAA